MAATNEDWERFASDLYMVHNDIKELADRINDLGNLGDQLTGGTRPDELACYASNSLQGTRALLCEMEKVVNGAQRLMPETRRKKR